MKKSLFIIFSLFLILFCGCSSTKTDSNISTPDPAEEYNELSGTWLVGGFYYNNKLIDINDDEALKDLYDSCLLTFDTDGTFMYINLFILEGNYRLIPEKNEQHVYLLTAEKLLTYDTDINDFIEEPYEINDRPQYLIYMEDENTFIMCNYDRISGTAVAGDEPMVYVRENHVSQYITDNKTPLK